MLRRSCILTKNLCQRQYTYCIASGCRRIVLADCFILIQSCRWYQLRFISLTSVALSDEKKPPDHIEINKTENKEIAANIESIVLNSPGADSTVTQPPKIVTGTRLKEATVEELNSTKDLLDKAKSIISKTIGKETDPPPPKIDNGRRRQKLDLNLSSLERNFILEDRAKAEFLLKSSDLEGLRKTKRRSAYDNGPPVTVYWRKDVEAKSLEIWGSYENLVKERLKRAIEEKAREQHSFIMRRRLRDYRKELERATTEKVSSDQSQTLLQNSSGRVVLTAVAINGCNFLFKLIAWLNTGSHSMFAETIHSLADTINQLILAFGIHKSLQRPDFDHPYGYANMRYVSSLISGVGIFCVGSGLSFYHGVLGLIDPTPLESFYWAFFILAGSLFSEGATLWVAFSSVKKGAIASGMTTYEYVWRGQDPSVNVVLLEDLAAVVGVGVAGTCMALSTVYNSNIPDAVGSLLVGGILGGVASFIIYSNVAALVGRSITEEHLNKINVELEQDVMVRAIYDVKGIDMGNSLVRYKAEMDFDGRQLTRIYLDMQDLVAMLEEAKKIDTTDDLEIFLLKHGEHIVDMLGSEIDRIERKLRKKFPEIRHCDLELL